MTKKKTLYEVIRPGLSRGTWQRKRRKLRKARIDIHEPLTKHTINKIRKEQNI